RALSKTKKKQITRELNEKWMTAAVQRYHAEQARPLTEDKTRKGLREIAKEVEGECFQKTKKQIHIAPLTLLRRVKGGQSIGEFNANKSWLSAEETETIITYAVETAKRGFPLSHRPLREHAEEI
ncbi:hypothetical protein FOMPIDRAFT_1101986, partial [Fomitopsis schrenkii]